MTNDTIIKETKKVNIGSMMFHVSEIEFMKALDKARKEEIEKKKNQVQEYRNYLENQPLIYSAFIISLLTELNKAFPDCKEPEKKKELTMKNCKNCGKESTHYFCDECETKIDVDEYFSDGSNEPKIWHMKGATAMLQSKEYVELEAKERKMGEIDD